MTVSSTAFRGSVGGEKLIGATQAIGFPLMAATELEIVEVIDATGVETPMVAGEMANYTVALSGTAPSDGTITFKTQLDSGSTWYYRRRVTKDQQTDYTALDKFPSLAHEQALDKLVLLAQDLDGDRVGSMRAPEQDGLLDMVLPKTIDRRLKTLGFDGSGQPIGIAALAGAITVSDPFGVSLITAANAAAARVILDAQEDLLTSQGDLVTRSAADVIRLARGSEAQVLTTSGSDVVWAAPAGVWPPYYIQGFPMSGPTATAFEVTIGMGTAMVHHNNTADKNLNNGILEAEFTKKLVNGWVAGDGENGAVDSLTANEWFAVFLLLKSSEPTVTDIAFDSNLNGANLADGSAPQLAGFDRLRRIGFVRANDNVAPDNIEPFDYMPDSGYFSWRDAQLVGNQTTTQAPLLIPVACTPNGTGTLPGVDINLRLSISGNTHDTWGHVGAGLAHVASVGVVDGWHEGVGLANTVINRNNSRTNDDGLTHHLSMTATKVVRLDANRQIDYQVASTATVGHATIGCDGFFFSRQDF